MDLNLNEFFSGLNLLLGICVFVLMETLKRVFAPFWEKPFGSRLLPLFPLIFGVGLAFMGLHEPSIQTWQEKLAIGIVAGFAAGHLFRIGKITIFGNGTEKTRKSKEPKEPPKEEPKP